MSELYIKPLQDYLKTLCIQHKVLLHNDATNVVFVRFQTYAQLSAIKNNAAKYFVIFDNITARVQGGVEENLLRQEVSFLFLKRTLPANGNTFSAIEAAMQAALEILFDFYERMKQDLFDDDCGPLKGLVPEQMTFEPVEGPVEEYHFGWLMHIPISVELPAYDANKWNLP